MKLLLILLLLSYAVDSESQQFPDYCVHLVKGNITLSHKGAKPVVVKQGQWVYNADIITFKKGAEVTLVDVKENFFVCTGGVKDSVKHIIKKAEKTTDLGLLGRYMSLLYHEFVAPAPGFETFKQNTYAGVPAGVGRFGDDCRIRVFPINNLQTSASQIHFRWHPQSPTGKHTLVVYDLGRKELVRKQVKDTMLVLNTKEVFNNLPGVYFWHVIPEGGDCMDNLGPFNLLSVKEESEQANKLLEGVAGETVEQQLKQIDILDKNAYINLAIARFEALVKKYPANKMLRKTYVQYLLQYGFEEMAANAWE